MPIIIEVSMKKSIELLWLYDKEKLYSEALFSHLKTPFNEQYSHT